ncbi:MAG: TonB-dependent receptor [Gammaproteobacteria bacterium]|jgi:iron complex outermembrane receptor protein|nr:TonB-dependent receptor [Gammaproteobacteria bacterium]
MKITRMTALLAAVGASTIMPVAIAEESTRSMEEVVVTSRRKDESVQDVPLSVTAFGEEAIAQIKPNTLRDFDGLVPNVYIGMNTAGPGASALYIRGVGYADIEKTQSPQVGVIVDGIQMGSSTGQLIDVFDVESIEINRGPQGVLFGKNTIGGNIVVNRVKPQFNDFGVKASAEMGNYNGRTMKARVNIPLIDDTLAFKFGAISRERDGFYDNVNLNRTSGDIDFSSQTAALAWAPSDRVEVNLTYDHIGDRSQTMPQDPRFDGDNRFINLADKVEPTTYEVDQLGLRIDWDLSDTMTLHYVGGSADGRDVVNQDFDGGDINGAAIPFAQLHTLRDQKYDIQSHELRLDIDINEQMSAMVGYYDFTSDLAFRQDTNNILQLPNVAIFGANVPCAAAGFRNNATPGLETFCQFPNARSTQLAGEQVDSSAWFGSVTYRATDDFEVTLGARSIDESKSAYNGYTDFSFNAADGRVTNPVYDDVSAPGYNEHDFRGLASIPGASYETPEKSWSETIITASASYRISDQSLAYASYSEGFRSGGFSIRNASGPDRAGYNPETADQFEIGVKNDFFENRLRVNLAYYVLNREGAQFSSIITLPPGSIPGTTTYINNGGESESKGIEIEGQWFLNDNLRLVFNYGTIDVENSAFTLACELVDGCVTAVVGELDPFGTLRNLGGGSDSRQPEDSLSISLAFDQEMSGGLFGANIGYKTVGDFLLVNTGGGADQRLYEGGYSQVDARVSYSFETSGGDQWSITAFGKNLTDEAFKEHALFLGGPTTGFQGWGAPRTYALELIWNH